MPKLKVGFSVLKRFEHHDLMIADKRNESTIRNQFDQHFDDSGRFHATVDVVTHANDGVVLFGLDFV